MAHRVRTGAFADAEECPDIDGSGDHGSGEHDGPGVPAVLLENDVAPPV